MFRPLEGRRVIDLTQVLAGPYCAYQLAILGADVIKVEPPEGGDWARAGGADAALGQAGMGTGYLTQNAGKRSLAVDLKTPEGRDIVLALADTADVFLENFRPGTAERLGLGFEAIRARNPAIVYASLSAYGQDGPMGARPAYDHVIQAVSGIMQLTGDPATLPNKVGAPYIDYATGLNGALAVLAALMERDRTGAGQQVDVAMLDTAMLLMASHMTVEAVTGVAPKASGNAAFSGSPASGVFETADGLLALAANNDRQFPRLARAIGRPDLVDDPRYRTLNDRLEHAAAFKAELQSAFRQATAAEWEDRLAAADVPAGRVRNLGETMALPQMAAREVMAAYDLPGDVEGKPRRIAAPTLGFKANGERPRAAGSPPALGQDTDAVLAGLGRSPAEIARLRAAGVIR